MPKCPECDRVFDISNKTDMDEWHHGHDCEAPPTKKSNDRAFQTGWSVMKAQKTPCNPPCTPREMIGRSWWKNLGYNSPCGCAHEKQSQGHEYMSDHYKEGEDA